MSMPYGLYVIVSTFTRVILFCSIPFKFKSFHLIGSSDNGTIDFSMGGLYKVPFKYQIQLKVNFKKNFKENLKYRMEEKREKFKVRLVILRHIIQNDFFLGSDF